MRAVASTLQCSKSHKENARSESRSQNDANNCHMRYILKAWRLKVYATRTGGEPFAQGAIA
jgi:hypothetical protein